MTEYNILKHSLNCFILDYSLLLCICIISFTNIFLPASVGFFHFPLLCYLGLVAMPTETTVSTIGVSLLHHSNFFHDPVFFQHPKFFFRGIIQLLEII
jgi:hypothetical protein